jgi:hypothetical protein
MTHCVKSRHTAVHHRDITSISNLDGGLTRDRLTASYPQRAPPAVAPQ